jgi:hypothetical protein
MLSFNHWLHQQMGILSGMQDLLICLLGTTSSGVPTKLKENITQDTAATSVEMDSK